MFALFFCGEFLLHIPYWLYFYLWSFSYTSHTGFIFICGVSLTHPILALFLSVEFLLHIPWLSLMWGETQAYTSRAGFIFYLGSFSYTSHGDFIFIAGSFSYTSRTGFVCIWGVSLTHPMLALVSVGNFSHTFHVNFFSLFFFFGGGGGGLFRHTMLTFFLSFFNLGSFYYTSRAGFYVWGVSLTHPMLALYLSGEFFIHIPFWLHFYLGSFSYTSHVGFFFFFFFFFILWSFSYTSRAGFIFMRGVSLTHPVLALFLSGEFLLHIPFLLYLFII